MLDTVKLFLGAATMIIISAVGFTLMFKLVFGIGQAVLDMTGL